MAYGLFAGGFKNSPQALDNMNKRSYYLKHEQMLMLTPPRLLRSAVILTWEQFMQFDLTSIDTPALILDLDAFDFNIATMASVARDAGLRLRPHAKTHKSAKLARAQLDAGAIGICCAKLGEAEALAAGGIADLLITSPVISSSGIQRLLALHRTSKNLMLVADNLSNIQQLSSAFAGAPYPLKILIDIDVGQERTGVKSARDALSLADAVRQSTSLELVGVQGYAGHLMHIADAAARKEMVRDAMARLQAILLALRAQGHACPIVTGGGTGTFDFDIGAGVLTELQTGSYVFMDTQYRDVQTADGTPWPFVQALFVASTVISVNNDNWVTTDGGLKAFATDGPNPEICSGAPAGAEYAFFGDEHGMVIIEDADQRPPLGTTIICAAPHCDPTVNLYDGYHAFRHGRFVGKISVDARGRSS